jgi:hypothetical protein
MIKLYLHHSACQVQKCDLLCTLAISLGVSKQKCFKNWICYHHQVWRFVLSWSPLEELVSVTGHQEQGSAIVNVQYCSAIVNIQYQQEIIEKWPMKVKQIRQNKAGSHVCGVRLFQTDTRRLKMRQDKWQNSQLYWMNKLINMMQKYEKIFVKQPDNSELGSTKLLCDWTSLTSRIQMEAISRHARDIKFVTQGMWADALHFWIRYWIHFLKPWFYLNICID